MTKAEKFKKAHYNSRLSIKLGYKKGFSYREVFAFELRQINKSLRTEMEEEKEFKLNIPYCEHKYRNRLKKRFTPTFDWETKVWIVKTKISFLQNNDLDKFIAA